MWIMIFIMYSIMIGIFDQMFEMSDNVIVMGKVFDVVKNDDLFYFLFEVFKNKDFQCVMKLFLFLDGYVVWFIILYRGDL